MLSRGRTTEIGTSSDAPTNKDEVGCQCARSPGVTASQSTDAVPERSSPKPWPRLAPASNPAHPPSVNAPTRGVQQAATLPDVSDTSAPVVRSLE